jgi:uncharacterized damage-inducible protein DinB
MNRQGIIELLRRAFDGAAWHGPSLMKILRQVQVSELNLRIADSHNIIELVEHLSAWRRFTIEKLRGNTTFELAEDRNFPQITPNEDSWQIALIQLESTQVQLIELLEQTDDSRLEQIVEGRTYSYYILLHGLIHHDIYHLGQIVLLRKIEGN